MNNTVSIFKLIYELPYFSSNQVVKYRLLIVDI